VNSQFGLTVQCSKWRQMDWGRFLDLRQEVCKRARFMQQGSCSGCLWHQLSMHGSELLLCCCPTQAGNIKRCSLSVCLSVSVSSVGKPCKVQSWQLIFHMVRVTANGRILRPKGQMSRSRGRVPHNIGAQHDTKNMTSFASPFRCLFPLSKRIQNDNSIRAYIYSRA